MNPQLVTAVELNSVTQGNKQAGERINMGVITFSLVTSNASSAGARLIRLHEGQDALIG